MHIVLAEPPGLFLEGCGHSRQVQPLALGYLASAVAPEHSVRLLVPDARAYAGSDPWGEIGRALEDESPDVLGISVVTALLPAARHLARLAKSRLPEVVVVVGGAHVSALPEATLRAEPAFDYALVGEAELSLPALLRCVEARRPVHEVPGLWWRDGEEIRRTRPWEPPPDLDALPMPQRDGLIWSADLQEAFYEGLLTQRGCPFRCTTCGRAGRGPLRRHSPARVIEEIARLRRDHAVPALFFHDPVFTFPLAQSAALCRALAGQAEVVPFSCQSRVEHLPETHLALLREAGCRHILLGIERGDLASLERMGKGGAGTDVAAVLAAIQAHGMRATGFFMVGFPWDDEETMGATVDYALGLPLDAVSLFSVVPWPGTAMWAELGGPDLGEVMDFREPLLNLTRLPDATYRAHFHGLRERVQAFNLERVMARAATLRAQHVVV